jgi:hypothetical protein
MELLAVGLSKIFRCAPKRTALRIPQPCIRLGRSKKRYSEAGKLVVDSSVDDDLPLLIFQ